MRVPKSPVTSGSQSLVPVGYEKVDATTGTCKTCVAITFGQRSFLRADQECFVPRGQHDTEADEVFLSIHDISDECQEADAVRIEARIAEFINANPSGKCHTRLSWKDPIASTTHTTHDNDACPTSDVSHSTRVALWGDGWQKETAESLGLHIELNERRQRKCSPAVLADVSRRGHRNQRLDTGQGDQTSGCFRIHFRQDAIQWVSHPQKVSQVFGFQGVAREALQNGQEWRM